MNMLRGNFLVAGKMTFSKKVFFLYLKRLIFFVDKENDIPVVDNSDVIPVIMMVIVKSKLHYFPSNLFYIKSLYVDLPEKTLLR